MDKFKVPCLLLLALLVCAALGVGMLVQGKIQQVVAGESWAETNALIVNLTAGLKDATAALTRTTAERDRLLEILADMEAGALRTGCATVLVCPKGPDTKEVH